MVADGAGSTPVNNTKNSFVTPLVKLLQQGQDELYNNLIPIWHRATKDSDQARHNRNNMQYVYSDINYFARIAKENYEEQKAAKERFIQETYNNLVARGMDPYEATIKAEQAGVRFDSEINRLSNSSTSYNTTLSEAKQNYVTATEDANSAQRAVTSAGNDVYSQAQSNAGYAFDIHKLTVMTPPSFDAMG